MNLCTVDGCDRPHSARGLCRTHYWRLRHHHTTSDDMPITRHTRPETLCPVCLQLIPDRAVAPIHPDSTGVQTCPMGGRQMHMETTIQPRLLAVNDAATYLGVSRSSLLRALDNGDIPRVRIAGRVLVDRHDLDTLIDTAKATA